MKKPYNSNRKKQHIRIVLKRDCGFNAKSTGMEVWDFVPSSLPETDLDRVDTKVPFLGKTLSMPLMITGMTGGFRGAGKINRSLAAACQEHGIALGLGSMRQYLEGKERESYRVRGQAPDAVIVGNIGGVQLARMEGDALTQAVRDLGLDGMAVHLNPLQECLQPEGEPSYSGVLDAIAGLRKSLPVPVIVKEVGHGISLDAASRLAAAGVEWIDVAGAGGTSWAAVESARSEDPDLCLAFRNWGIPTADCLIRLKGICGLRLIASGGLRSGLDLAKGIALGAELGGAALPFLEAWAKGGVSGISGLIRRWSDEFRRVLFLTGSLGVPDLRREGVLIRR